MSTSLLRDVVEGRLNEMVVCDGTTDDFGDEGRTTLVGGMRWSAEYWLNGASAGRRCRGAVSDIERRMSSWGFLDASDDILGLRLERRRFMDGGA